MHWHAWHLCCMELTFWKIPGVSGTHPAASRILSTKSSSVSTGVSYTSPFKNPRETGLVIMVSMQFVHREQSSRQEKVACRCDVCTEMCGSAILLKLNASMNRHGTLFSISGRTSCKNLRYMEPFSLSGKMYEPSKQSPTMPAHIVTENFLCVACRCVACGFSSAHLSRLWQFIIPSNENAASFVNRTLAVKCWSAAFSCKILCAKSIWLL